MSISSASNQSFEDGECESVVVGILTDPKNTSLIIQSLPMSEKDSRFYLLDRSSICDNGQSKFKFNINDLHVFLQIRATEKLKEPILHKDKEQAETDLVNARNEENANRLQFQRIIEAKVTHYEMDKDLLKINCPLIRGSRHFRKKKRERKARRERRSKSTAAFINQQAPIDLPENEDNSLWIPHDSTLVGLIVEESDENDLIRVVATHSYRAFPAKLRKELASYKVHQFIRANYFQADPFFQLRWMFNTLCIMKNYDLEAYYKKKEENTAIKYDFYRRKMYEGVDFDNLNDEAIRNFEQDCLLLRHYNRAQASKHPPMGDLYLFDIRRLTAEEEDKIRSCCQDDRKVEWNDARLFIRDPAIAINRNKSYMALKLSREYTITSKIVAVANDRLKISIGPEEIKQFIQHGSPWREGADMKLWHKVLQREKNSIFGVYTRCDADVIVDQIKISNDGTQAQIYLRPARHCADLFEILRHFHTKIKGEAQVGPTDRDGSAENEITALFKFSELLRTNRELFDQFRCKRVYNQIDSIRSSIIKIKDKATSREIFLDKSQLESLHKAFQNDGITCIQAPPGSGKTMVSHDVM